MKKRKPGRPTKYANGAMSTLRVRVPQSIIDYLDSKGNRSQAARDILRRAMDEESGAPKCKCGDSIYCDGYCVASYRDDST